MNIVAKKIDPRVRKSVHPSSDEPCKVFLYTDQYTKCLPELKTMGAKITNELPLINGCVVEIPANKLKLLALCKYIRYVAADMDIKAQTQDVCAGKYDPDFIDWR